MDQSNDYTQPASPSVGQNAPVDNTPAGDAPPVRERLSIGSILGRALDVMKNNLFVLIGIALIAVVPPFVLQLLIMGGAAADMVMDPMYGPAEPSMTYSVLSFLVSLLDLLLGLMLQGAVAVCVYRYLQGSKATIGSSISAVMPNLVALVIAAIIMGVAVALGFLLLIIPGVLLLLVFFVTVPACVVERIGPIQSLQRSIALTKGYRVEIFLLIIILCLIIIVATFVVGLILALITQNVFIVAIGTVIAYMLTYIFSCVAGAIVYADLRMRKDGIGLDRLVQVFE